MSVLNKLLGWFKDDIDDDGDYYSDTDDQEVESISYMEQEKDSVTTSRFSSKFNAKKAPVGQDSYEEPEQKQYGFGSRRSTTKVVKLSHHKDTEVVVIKPTSLDDSTYITSELKAGNPVVLNFEELEIETAQRIIDFVAGACFAINGNLQAVNRVIFIVAPANVDIVGDLTKELISSGIIVPNINKD